MARSLSNLLRTQLPLWLVIPLLGFTLVSGSAVGTLVTWAFSPTTNCPESPGVCEQFSLFWQVWALASNNFVDPDSVKPEMMIDGAINGMLDSLGDQGHTRFLPAEAAARWDESLSGEFEGIGAYLDIRDGQALIVAPIKGSPAEDAGLKAGDIIIKVNGEDTYGWTIEELVTQVRGPKGTTVNLTVQHPETEDIRDITVRRDKIEVPSVNWQLLPGEVALVQINSFSQGTTDELQNALSQAQQQGAHMVILDLRNNLGGFVHEAIGVASQFLPEGTPVLVEQDRSGGRTVSKTRGGGVALDMPMVVLVNGNTASSAEIVSGALQDAGRAKLVGTTTVGTGTVLTTYDLQDGAKLLLGTIRWLTPEGRLIHRQGIAPDVEVTLPPEAQLLQPSAAAALSAQELRENGDAQFVEALELLGKMSRQAQP